MIASVVPLESIKKGRAYFVQSKYGTGEIRRVETVSDIRVGAICFESGRFRVKSEYGKQWWCWEFKNLRRNKQGGESDLKKIELYKCEICGTEYKFPQDCQNCEKYHVQPASIVSAKWQPYNQQSADKYPTKVCVRMSDGKTVEYKR